MERFTSNFHKEKKKKKGKGNLQNHIYTRAIVQHITLKYALGL